MFGVIGADGKNYVVSVSGRREAVEALKAMTSASAAKGTWAWALEQMKAGRSVHGGEFLCPIRIDHDGDVVLDNGENAPFNVTDFIAINWQLAEGEGSDNV